ncbi:MAG: hypothetical protein ACI90V_014140, partial [Bacillariaceae sp.]
VQYIHTMIDFVKSPKTVSHRQVRGLSKRT